MTERMSAENCIKVGRALCNGCPVVDVALDRLIDRPTEPITVLLREVGEVHCPDGKRPEFVVLGNFPPVNKNRVDRLAGMAEAAV